MTNNLVKVEIEVWMDPEGIAMHNIADAVTADASYNWHTDLQLCRLRVISATATPTE